MKKVIKRLSISVSGSDNIIKTATVIFVVLISCTISSSARPGDKLSKEKAVDIYINALTHGSLDAATNNVIDKDAEFNITLRENVSRVNKNVMLRYFKNVQDVEQNCTSTRSVIHDADDTKYVIRVDMKYGDFTRTDIITTERIRNDWKITRVDTSFS